MRLVSLLTKSFTVLLLASAMAFLSTGCGGGVFAPSADSLAQGGTLAGMVHGGNQPVSGATISLYAVGTSGYGSGAVLYAQTTSQNDGAGSFSFTQTTGTTPTGPPSSISSTYACPTGSTTNPNPQMYIVASGGETQGTGNGTNTAAVFAVAIGKCSTASSVFVDMNEVTSVATMATLQQYFNPVAESFGYPNTTQAAQGFANGVTAISSLADVVHGTTVMSVLRSATPSGSSNSVTVTVQPEPGKVNLIANILAACVNNPTRTNSSCNTLFADAVPPVAAATSQPSADYTSITPSNEDTLQALYFMMTNYDSGGVAANMNGLFGLVAAVGAPFQTSLATQPTDWTIGILYTGTTACTMKTPVASYGTTNTNNFLYSVEGAAIDANGNVWAQGNNAGDLYQMGPDGTPLTCTMGGMTGGGLSYASIDANGYVWINPSTAPSEVNSDFALYKVNPTTGALDSTWDIGKTKALATTIDGYNNVFYTTTTSTSSSDNLDGSVWQFAGAGATGTSNTGAAAITASEIASGIQSTPYAIQVDSSDRLWIPIQDSNATVTTQGFFEVYPSNNTSGTTYLTGTSNGSFTGFEHLNLAASLSLADTYYVAVGQSNVYTVWGGKYTASPGEDRISTIIPNATPANNMVSLSAADIGSLQVGNGVAVDGAGNVWAISNTKPAGNWVTASTTAVGAGSIAVVSSAGAALSATGTKGGIQKASSFLAASNRGLAVDPAGNVWFGINNGAGDGIFEIVGAAVPAVTPLSVAAANGKLGQMP